MAAVIRRAGRSRLHLLWTMGFLAGCNHAPARPPAVGPTEVRPGSHVRVLAPGVADGALVGHVLAMEEDGLLLQVGLSRARVSVPFAVMDRLEVTYGTSREDGQAIGAGVGGLVLGLLLGLPAAALTESGSDEAARNFAVVALVGVAIGAAIGSLTAGGAVGEWVDVEVPLAEDNLGIGR